MAENPIYFSFIPQDKYRVIERSDYRIRVNGVYKGHVYNENRGILNVFQENDGSYSVDGTFYVFEELTKDGYRKASKVDEINRTRFSLYSSGEMIMMEMKSLRIFPVLMMFPLFLK